MHDKYCIGPLWRSTLTDSRHSVEMPFDHAHFCNCNRCIWHPRVASTGGYVTDRLVRAGRRRLAPIPNIRLSRL